MTLQDHSVQYSLHVEDRIGRKLVRHQNCVCSILMHGIIIIIIDDRRKVHLDRHQTPHQEPRQSLDVDVVNRLNIS